MAPKTGPAVSMLPDSRPCRCFRAGLSGKSLQFGPADFRRRTSYAPLTTGSAEFSAQQSLCAPAIRPCGLSGVEHRMLPRQGPAVFSAQKSLSDSLRTRRRTSYAPLTTGSAEFSAQQSLCAPAIRPCGLSGVEHLMLPRQQALLCFRRRSHFPSLQFGPADFPASNILCSPDNRLCRVFGAAITLRPLHGMLRPCGLSGVEHLMLP